MNLSCYFSLYGRDATLHGADGTEKSFMNAIISPLRYKNKMYLYGVNTEIGYNSEGHYLYIGPPEPDITEAGDGDYIKCGTKKYRIDRAEKVYMKNEPFYIWAVIREMVDADEEITDVEENTNE